MNELQHKFTILRAQLRFTILMRGVGLLLATVLGAFLLAGFVDWFLPLPALIRAMLLLAIIVASIAVGYQYLIAPLRTNLDDLSLALRVEDHYPVLNDGLASTVEFLQQPEGGPAGISPSMRNEAIKRALRLAEGCDFNKIVDRKGLPTICLSSAGLFGLGVLLFLFYPTFSMTGVLRVLDPFGHHTWTILRADVPDELARGQGYTFTAMVDGIIPKTAVLQIDDKDASQKEVKVVQDKKTKKWMLSYAFDMTKYDKKLRFRVTANDASFPRVPGSWHEIAIKPPPELIDYKGLPSPQIELRHPHYTRVPSPEQLSPGRWHMEMTAGTTVVMRGAVDRPIQKAWVEFHYEDQKIRPASMLTILGADHALGAALATTVSRNVWENPTANTKFGLAENGRSFAIEFQPWITATYKLHLLDRSDPPRPNVYPSSDRGVLMTVNHDPKPSVQLLDPDSSRPLMKNADVTLKVVAEDDPFALRTVYLRYRRETEAKIPLEERWKTLPFYDYRLHQKAFPQWLTILEPKDIPDDADPTETFLKRVSVNYRWSLAGLVDVGDVLVIQAAADDFNDVLSSEPPSVSSEIRLRIVSRPDLDAHLLKGLAGVQRELMRLQKVQDRALKMVERVQKDPDAQHEEKHKDLIMAKRLQAQIRTAVGVTEDKGIREDIAKLLETIKDNKLPPSEIETQLRAVKKELQRVQQQNLEPLVPQVGEALKELNAQKDGKKPEKSDPKQKAPDKKRPELDKAKELQTDAKKALDDLAKYLQPWTDVAQITERARDIAAEQAKIRGKIEKMRFKRPADLSKDEKEDLKDAADQQNALAGKMQDLIGMMKKVANERTGKSDKSDDPIKKAVDQSEKADVPDAMRKAKDAITKGQFNDAVNKQEQIERDIRSMIQALENQPDDHIDKLLKKHEKAKKKLDELQKKMDILQKKAEEAKDDPRKLKDLADKQRELQKEVEEAARQLAKLDAGRAKEALDKAGADMGKAANKMEMGENPEDEQKQAQKQLDDAKKELAESEEKLARERLARIADRLKGLKLRQDAAIDESERLYKQAIEAKKGWSPALQTTLKDQKTIQEGLAEETAILKDKLKDAKVFHHLLKKAEKNMLDAATAMGERIDRIRDFPDIALDKETIKIENSDHEKIIRLQKRASSRLGHLEQALKDELNKKEKKDEEKPGKAKDEEPKKDEPQQKKGGIRSQDGIPPMAQLKALRAEQEDINDQTKDFAKRHPDLSKLNQDQLAELDELQRSQLELLELFEEINQPPAQDEQPAPKIEEKK